MTKPQSLVVELHNILHYRLIFKIACLNLLPHLFRNAIIHYYRLKLISIMEQKFYLRGNKWQAYSCIEYIALY